MRSRRCSPVSLDLFGAPRPQRERPRSATATRTIVVVKWIAFILVVALLLVPVILYNGLVTKRNACRSAWGSIDAQLTKRHDLIPQLVATVSGAMAHERNTLAAVTEARERARAETDPDRRLVAEDSLGGAISHLMARAEAYPELAANGNALHLQRALTEVESQISAARRAYNSNVERYNNAVHTLPSSIIAGAAGFSEGDYHRAAHEHRTAPRTNL